MNATRQFRGQASRRRRGTALVETAMCIPLLATLLGLTAFLGWAMMNQQNVKAAARYTSWRHVYGRWPGVTTDPNDDSMIDPNAPDDPNHPGLNELFFRGKAVDVGVSGNGGQVDEFEQLIGVAYGYSEYAGTFADRLILHPLPDHGHFPHARLAHVWADFRSDMEILNKYRGEIHSRHIRDGVEWRRRQAGCRHVTRDQFLMGLDSVLESVRAPGDSMGQMCRSLYRNGW
ncbi:MAG TPA: TadE/TadG family type IV pilus assembly protein [Phycisphaerae bacterium]|nr:TadE/TadG family type IV pilus assembly protein [Phycisphaerae bacterium]HUU21820.1 TadE/TadG family type IV pilus assembly protein [Phycisphaerae bacterium]